MIGVLIIPLPIKLDNVVQSIQSIVHGPFHDVCSVIDPRCSPSALLSNLVSSPSMPFYTALIVHAPSKHARHYATALFSTHHRSAPSALFSRPHDHHSPQHGYTYNRLPTNARPKSPPRSRILLPPHFLPLAPRRPLSVARDSYNLAYGSRRPVPALA